MFGSPALTIATSTPPLFHNFATYRETKLQLRGEFTHAIGVDA
jgi:hypothetical protein